ESDTGERSASCTTTTAPEVRCCGRYSAAQGREHLPSLDTAAVGRSKGIMKVFDDIAIHRCLDQSFGLKKPGTAMRTRFTNRVTQYKTDQCQSMRKSGTVEEYAERKILHQNEAQRKEDQAYKQRGIVHSGELLRSLAMGEIASEKSVGQAGLNDGANSGCKRKITKRKRLDVVANGIPSVLLASEDEKAKFQYKMQRLQFEREQEDKNRLHATENAEKGRVHELQLECRRCQADE
ncbi:hypothetical protein GN958_ATG10628, partial [Phytophthora infestans]